MKIDIRAWHKKEKWMDEVCEGERDMNLPKIKKASDMMESYQLTWERGSDYTYQLPSPFWFDMRDRTEVTK